MTTPTTSARVTITHHTHVATIQHANKRASVSDSAAT